VPPAGLIGQVPHRWKIIPYDGEKKYNFLFRIPTTGMRARTTA